jgi:DNA-binding winged helix-turn-helix (wHTH) protein/tetratricopeptide (TPR) repeat protein
MQEFRKIPKKTENVPHARFYEFGPYVLNPLKRIVLQHGEPVALTPKCFDVLLALVEHAGEVLIKEELMESVWPDTIVEEGNLNRNVSTLRKVLGESPNNHRYIVTVPGRGYRFVAKVREVSEEHAKLAWQELKGTNLSEALEFPPETAVGKAAARPISVPLPSIVRPQRPKRILGPASRLLWLAIGVAAGSLALLILFKSGFRAKPVLSVNDLILIADFSNTTGDPVFDDTLKQALSVQLTQSPYLNILSDARIHAGLQLMTKPQATKLTSELAQDLCQRTGCKTYITGSIASLGNQFVIGLRAINCQTGDFLAQEQVTAKNKESVLKALDEAGTNLRKKLGESLLTVQRFDTPLAEATTPSLEALKAYSLGIKKVQENDIAAVPFFKRAIEFDPNFASAYEALGVAYYNLGESGLSRENFAKAYEFRERVSEREKYMIAARYYSYVSGDLERAIETYQLWQQAYPRDASAHANLGGLYGAVGQYEKAIDETLEGVRFNPDAGSNYSNLLLSYAALNRLDAAKRAYEQEIARKIEDPVSKANRFGIAFIEGDTGEMDRLMAWSVGKPEGEDILLAAKSDAEAFAGHAEKAQEFSRRAVQSALRSFQKETAAQYQMDEALWQAEFGNREIARQHTAAALALTGNHDTQILASLALARTGDFAQAEKMANDLGNRYPSDTLVNSYWLPAIRGAIEINRNEPTIAIKLLVAATPYELASPQAWSGLGGPLYPAYLRGWAYLLLRQGSDAATEFQKLIDNPGFMLACPLRPLAHLGLARAYALQANATKARSAYQGFFNLWKDADPNIPVLKQAKLEYAKLQ